MGSFSNVIEKRITKTTNGVASKMLQKLKSKDEKDNISKITFPSNLENQAESTYMVIYVFDNAKNNQTMSSTIFKSEIDEDSYEIGAITFLKEKYKQAEKVVKDKLNVDSAINWLKKQEEALKDEVTSVKIGESSDIKDFVNDYLVPKRKKSESKALRDSLDPTKHPDSGYKIVKAIQIQMPSSSLTYKYENGWESTSTETLNVIRTLISGFSDLASGLFGEEGATAKGSAQLRSVYDKVANAIGDAVTGGGYTADAQAKGQYVYNPVLVFNYTIPQPRTFSYSFALYPRNKDELYTLFNLIQTLKFYALPEIRDTEKRTGGQQQAITYRYPAKFAIKFYTNGYENKWFPKTATLGLTSIEETLTGDNGDMAYFENYFDKYAGNPPRMVKLTLSFKELAIMSREYINQGF